MKPVTTGMPGISCQCRLDASVIGQQLRAPELAVGPHADVVGVARGRFETRCAECGSDGPHAHAFAEGVQRVARARAQFADEADAAAEICRARSKQILVQVLCQAELLADPRGAWPPAGPGRRAP